LNPYEPPKAPVRDAAGPPRLPLALRVLRFAAVVGSALLGVIALAVFATRPETKVFIFSFGLLLLSVTSILALVSRVAPRRMYWGAMAINSVAVVLLNLAVSPGSLLFIVPALLNLMAIELLRRARARLA
jgi:hypothetical protein